MTRLARTLAHWINNLLGAYDRAHRIGADEVEVQDAVNEMLDRVEWASENYAPPPTLTWRGVDLVAMSAVNFGPPEQAFRITLSPIDPLLWEGDNA